MGRDEKLRANRVRGKNLWEKTVWGASWGLSLFLGELETQVFLSQKYQHSHLHSSRSGSQTEAPGAVYLLII